VNYLFITLDQFRADCLGVAGHPLVKTPVLDMLAAEGLHLSRHFAQAAPCAPGRAALYTGTYQSTNRVVANGSPLDGRFDNVALAARRAGYEPALFGYTDQAVDPRVVSGRDDPRLNYYDGVLPGFDPVLRMPEDQAPWRDWLEAQGFDPRSNYLEALSDEPTRPAELSSSAFLTHEFLGWLGKQDDAWFAHLSYLRPHPPYAAAGSFSTMYNPADIALPIPPTDDPHPLHELALGVEQIRAPQDPQAMREVRAQYYGMISEVDAQLGRIVEALKAQGTWEETVIIVTADHGEQLGDHGLMEKLGFFEQSYAILGIIRDPRHPESRGSTVSSFTENVDVMPTLCEMMGLEVPLQCDGYSLLPFLRGEAPPTWRTSAHYEWDWRYLVLDSMDLTWPWGRRIQEQNLAVLRGEDFAYVQFGDGSSLDFDLGADPTWKTLNKDLSRELVHAKEMLVWRQTHLERTFTEMLVGEQRLGRWPEGLR